MSGTPDPLSLPSMHHLLDVVEMIIVEGLGSRSEIQRYYFRTYKPTARELVTAFTPEDSDASFDAFTSALGGMH